MSEKAITGESAGKTGEEADELSRSRKKVRKQAGGFTNEVSNPPREEDWMVEEGEGGEPKEMGGYDNVEAVKSYREILAPPPRRSTGLRMGDRTEEEAGTDSEDEIDLEDVLKEVEVIQTARGFDFRPAVQGWKADFDPEKEKIERIAAWVRFPRLPTEYYDKNFLYVLAHKIGKVLKVDNWTMRRAKGNFARVCVELDLSQPLEATYSIWGKERRLEYEGIHFICYKCGRFGHSMETCDRRLEDGMRNTGENGTEARGPKPGEMSTETEKPRYGEWMTVQQPWRGRRANPENNANLPRRDSRSMGARI